MKISKDLVREIILEVLQQNEGGDAPASDTTAPAQPLQLRDLGPAKLGTSNSEVVIGVPPAFGTEMTSTIIGIPHTDVLHEVTAGIEEEGLKYRLVRVNRTADVGFIAHEAAKLSGSGVGIGIICRGTTVIHQRDLQPLQNLELFPQSPLVDRETFRAIGRNAARYAKGESPDPVPVRNDPMARPTYQGLAALLQNKEVQFLNKGLPSEELAVQL